MTIRDEKYVVFKRDDWEQFKRWMGDEHGEQGNGLSINEFSESVVQDAVVIRTQDVFAGPALHSYAACIEMAARVASASGAGAYVVCSNMREIADYFHQRACEADEYAQLDKAKVPD